jgi:UDP-glucuronate decarboxylase
MYNHSVIKEDCQRLTARVDYKQFSNSNIFITGANGLIGGFLSDFFDYINEEYKLGINLYLTSYSPKERLTRIKNLVNKNNVHYFDWDSSERVDTNNLPSKIDYCFFCSGYGQPSKFLENNIKTCLLNVVGVESILSYMNRRGGKFLFMSTSELYGNPPDEHIPTPETYGGNYDISNNRAGYNISKCLGEIICKEYGKSNVETKIARVALTYGPGTLLSDKRVLQEFIFKAKEGTIKMLDQGQSKRNYLYISDSIELMLKIILKGKDLIYNIGGDTEEISICDLATSIASHFNAIVIPGKNTTKEVVKKAPNTVKLCMSKIRNEFPEYGKNIVSLEEGLKNTIRWYNFIGENNDK